jgi:alpha-N-arabinofuranosidase
VYNSTTDIPVSLQFEGFAKGATAELTVQTGPQDPYGYNDPFLQNNVVKESTVTLTAGDKGTFEFSLPPLSVAVLETDGKGKTCVKRKKRAEALKV